MLDIKSLLTVTGACVCLLACQTQQIQSTNQLANPPAEENVTVVTEPPEPKLCTIEEYGDPQFELNQNLVLWQRIRDGYAIPDSNHRRIQNYLNWYQRNPGYLDRVSERGEPYLFYIVEELEKAGLPLELALLPIVESAFDPFAYSHGRAAGMWQFVPGTAKHYGLKQNWWYDGRRDIVASTEAAITYLTYLRDFFDGDWLMALAAYNSGEGTVRRAIRKNRRAGKNDDYWSLNLPRETAAYVPQLLALAKIVGNPEHYQISLRPIDNRAQFQKVPIGSQIDLSQAAELAEIDIETLYRFNPGFNRWATDPTGPHELLIPVEKTTAFVNNLSQLSPEKRVGWERYTIQRGDSLITIAQKFNTEVATLKSVNGLNGHIIRAGQALMIPVALSSDQHYSLSADQRLAKRQNRNPTGNRRKTTYLTQSGDSLWVIARKFNVGVRQLAKWNGMAPTDPLSVNKELVVWLKPNQNTALADQTRDNNAIVRKVHYRVRNGDSFARIAQKFNLTIADIKKWNTNRARQKYLQPGDSLTLFVDVKNIN